MNVLRTAEAPARVDGPELDHALTRLAGRIGLGVMASGRSLYCLLLTEPPPGDSA